MSDEQKGRSGGCIFSQLIFTDEQLTSVERTQINLSSLQTCSCTYCLHSAFSLSHSLLSCCTIVFEVSSSFSDHKSLSSRGLLYPWIAMLHIWRKTVQFSLENSTLSIASNSRTIKLTKARRYSTERRWENNYHPLFLLLMFAIKGRTWRISDYMYFIENTTSEKKRTIKTSYKKHLDEIVVLNGNSEALEVKIIKSIWSNSQRWTKCKNEAYWS